jgi:hypothetical protein
MKYIHIAPAKFFLFAFFVLFCGVGCSDFFGESKDARVIGVVKNTGYDERFAKKIPPTDSGNQKNGVSSCFKKNCLYIDNVRHFSLNYPESWQVREGVLGTAVTFVTPFTSAKDSFAENISVVTEEVVPGTTVDMYYKNSEENIKKYFSDFKLLKSEPVMLGDFLGRMVVYSSVQGSVRLKTTQLFVINQGVAYVITITNIQSDPTAFAKEMMAVAQSFRLVK